MMRIRRGGITYYKAYTYFLSKDPKKYYVDRLTTAHLWLTKEELEKGIARAKRFRHAT